VFSSYLTRIDSLPFFAECKRKSHDLLNATPERRILEVGCGFGTTPQRWRSSLLRAVRSSRSTGAKR
jgi:hypothetical protein